MKKLLVFIALFPITCFADAGQAVGGAIDKVIGLIPQGGVVASIAVVLEIAFRAVKSDKPLSLLRGLSVCIHKIGDLCLALDGFLDKVIPNKTV